MFMRRYTILLAVSLLTSFLIIIPHYKKSVISRSILREREGEKADVDNEEELVARLQQEILMTKDPSLGYVPTERLTIAEQTATKLNKAAKENGALNLIWNERGPNNLGGRSRSILIDQSDATGNTVFVGSVGGGLWRTTNFLSATPTWTQIASVSQNLAITTLAQDPNTLTTMYAGTGEGYGNVDAIRGLGIYKSTDAGLTWTLLASTTTGGAAVNNLNYVQKILVYTNGDVYASGISASFCNAGGILKSTNGGSTWTRVIGIYTGCGSCACATNFLGYDIVRSLNGDLYATTVDATTGLGHIWKSLAGATVGNSGTWTDITPTGTFQRIQLACSATNNSKMYALMQGSGSAVGGIRVTTDGGSTWANIDNSTSWCNQGVASGPDFSNGQAWYDLAIAVNPSDDQTVFVGGVDAMKTTNGGSAWTQATQWASGCGVLPNIHADIHNIVYLPGSSTQFIIVNDGGIYYTGDGGTSFTNKSAGYRTIQYYSAALHPTSGSNYMLGGAQDNGTHKFSSAGLGPITTASGGDGGFCFIDQNDPTYQISSYVYAEYFISRNSGTSFSTTANFGGSSPNNNGRFINPTDYDNTQKLIYASYSDANMVRIKNITAGAPASTTINFPLAGTMRVSAVKVDPNTLNRVWVAFSSSSTSSAPQIYYVDNANGASPTITQVTNPGIPSGAYVSSLDIEQGNASHVIMTVSNYGISSVWESTDLGSTWTSLDNNGVNLPDIPVRWAIFLPSGYSFTGRMNVAVGGIMLATELGVWTTTTPNGTSTAWTQSSGLPNVRVDMLVLRNSDKTVAAATHGRGLFTAQLQSILPATLLTFDGQIKNNSVVLNWNTSQEYNCKDFDVEKSINGLSYFKIGSVGASGNSAAVKNYSFVDNKIGPINYYRLRINDFDGRNQLSKIVSIRYNGARQGVWVINNPFTNYIDLRFSRAGSVAKLQLINTTGAIVTEKLVTASSGELRWNLPVYLPAGNYVVKATVDGQQFTTKVIRQ
jgi:hypothetical protein